MGRKLLMTWDGSPNYRWRKMFKNKIFTITCAELNAPRTLVGSYQAANSWWKSIEKSASGLGFKKTLLKTQIVINSDFFKKIVALLD